MKSNMRIIKYVFLAILSTVSVSFADPVPDRTPRDQPVTVGKWHSDLEKARAYAEANGLPLVAVWSNARFCNHCAQFERTIDSAVFKNWMKDSGIVFYFGCVYDGQYSDTFGIGPSSDGKEGYHGTSFYWCRMKNGSSDPFAGKSWPYVRIYWPKGRVDEMRSGAQVDGEGVVYGFPCGATDQMIEQNPGRWPFVEKGDYKTYNPAGRFAIDFLMNKDYGLLRNFKATPAYNGGEFGVFDELVEDDGGGICSPSDGRGQFELEIGTQLTSVTIPLTRTNTAVQASVATNCYMATFPDGSNTGIKQLVWAAGETYKELKIEFAASNLVQSSRNNIEILLGNDKVQVVGTAHVELVDPVPNSPKNPKWIGESPIKPGVWTMDYAGAVDAVKAFNTNEVYKADGKKAYTLLLFGGSLWCPDCSNNERYITDSVEFKAWATNAVNPIACVAVDLPYENESGAPSLLSWRTAQTDTGKQYFGGVTGAGYLTRHGVPLTGNNGINAEAILKRNIGATLKDTVDGGFCKPGTIGFRKPTYVLMRDDGSVIGRIAHFGHDSKMLTTNSAETVVKRLNELIAQDAYASIHDREERNDHPKSIVADPDAVLSARNKNGLSGTLSFVDAVDYYRIAANAGTELSLDFSVEGGARLIMEVVDYQTGAVVPFSGAVTNNSATAKSLQCVLPSPSCYVKVSYPVDNRTFSLDEHFAFTNKASTLCGYTIKSDSVYNASQEESIEEIIDEILEVVIKLRHDVAYKFSGLDPNGESVKSSLVYNSENDTYTLSPDVEEGAVKLEIAKPDSGNPKFGFQEWVPGSVYFLQSSGRVTEKGDNPEENNFEYKFKIQRSIDAVSGTAKVEVRFNAEESAFIDDPNDGKTFEFNTCTNQWNEGECDERELSVLIKANQLADGVQTLVFDLVKLEGSDANADAAAGSIIGKFTLTVVDDDEASPGVIALTGAAGDKIPANRTVVAKGGSELTLTVSRLENADGVYSGEVTVNGESVATYSWGTRQNGDQNVTVTLPEYVADSANKVTIAAVGINGAKVDAAYKYLTVKLVPEESAQFNVTSVKIDAVRYVKPSEDVWMVVNEVADPTKLAVRKLSGALAPGQRWVYDNANQKLMITGTPTAIGEYVAVFQVSEDGVPGGTVQVTVKVVDPAIAETVPESDVNDTIVNARTFSDCMVLDSENKRLVGLLTVTVVRSGRLSAKFRPVEGESISLMANEWCAFANGTYTAELIDISSAERDYKLTVNASADGRVNFEFAKGESKFDSIVQSGVWAADDSARQWEGYYTVSLPKVKTISGTALAAGDAYITLKMQGEAAVNSGKMTYAGLLPNGKAVSGAAIVACVDTGSNSVVLPVMSVSASDTFTGVLQVNKWEEASQYARVVEPYSTISPYWKHTEPIDSASYEVQLNAFGCRYTGDEDLVACCEGVFTEFSGTNLSFYAMCDKMSVPELESATCTNTAPVFVEMNNLSIYGQNTGVALYFNRSTGVVYGTTLIEFDNGETVTALFKGVVLPGWGAASCSTCSEGTTQRPFVSGSCFFSDVLRYTDRAERNRTLSVKRSCPFSIGSEPGI